MTYNVFDGTLNLTQSINCRAPTNTCTQVRMQGGIGVNRRKTTIKFWWVYVL